jgi:hypothetical protein
MGTSSRFVEEENRTNGGKKSPVGRNRRLPVAHRFLAARWHEHSKRRQARPVQGKQSGIPGYSLNQESLRAAKMHNPKPVARPNFTLHSVKMVFHGLFRQAKLVRNFLVRQSLCDQRNDLLFPPR